MKQVSDISSVLVRLAINVILAFLCDTFALDTLLNLGNEAVHVLLVSAYQSDSVSRLTPPRVTTTLH